MNEYTQKENEATKTLCDELNALNTPYKFELSPVLDDRVEIVLTGIIPIRLMYYGYRKEYGVYLNHKLPYVRYETEKKYTEDNKQPQTMHVLNKKRLVDWIEYRIKQFEALIEICKERVTKVTEFEQEIVKRGGTISKKDYYGAFDGEITNNYIELSYQVYDEGYISTKIAVRTYPLNENDFIKFDKLSDNGYKN